MEEIEFLEDNFSQSAPYNYNKKKKKKFQRFLTLSMKRGIQNCREKNKKLIPKRKMCQWKFITFLPSLHHTQIMGILFSGIRTKPVLTTSFLIIWP